MGLKRSIVVLTVCGLIAGAAWPATGGAATWTRSNATPIGPTGGDGPKVPYPSTILVEQIPGTVTDVNVRLLGARATLGSDFDVVLLGPSGQNTMLMSDVCNNFFSLPGNDFTFDDAAAVGIGDDPNCPSGTYRPVNAGGVADPFPAPAPAAPHGTALGVHNGASSNGNWNLYVVKEAGFSSGDISRGWQLELSTTDSIGPAGQCGGTAATMLGTDGNDDLVGTPGKDVIVGFKGRDEIQGLGGKDLLCGQEGKDTLIGGGGKDKLFGQGGKDKCTGGKGKDTGRSCETERSL